MDPEPTTVSTRDLSETAESFSYRYKVPSLPDPAAGAEAAQFTGVLGTRRLPCGLRLCASDLTALHDGEHDGSVPRSLTLALVLDGEPKVKFAAVFGQPIFAFLRDLRLERAFEGLQSEGWTVSQAAYFVGYRHPSSFSEAFRRKFGVAPQAVGRAFPRGSAST